MFKEVTLSVLLLASLASAADSTTALPADAPTTAKPTEGPTPDPTTAKPTDTPYPTTAKPIEGPTTTPGPVAECEQLTLDGCGGKFPKLILNLF